jgi:hypothetical protein
LEFFTLYPSQLVPVNPLVIVARHQASLGGITFLVLGAFVIRLTLEIGAIRKFSVSSVVLVRFAVAVEAL